MMKKTHRICYRLKQEQKEFRLFLIEQVQKKLPFLVTPSEVSRAFFMALLDDKELTDTIGRRMIKILKKKIA